MANTPIRSSFPAVVAIVGVFLIFSVLLNYAYIDRPEPEDVAASRPSLLEHKAKQSVLLESAAVTDASSGKVRLPIDRAKRLILEEYAK